MLRTMRRLAALLIYAAIFAGELLWNGFVPLVPGLADQYDLSKVQAGVLLAASSAAILVVSAPAAAVCERIGPRRLTAASTGVIAVSSVWQAYAASFGSLVGARVLFGVGFGIIWVSGLRWLSELAGAREAQALALTVTTAGLSSVVGPALGAVAVAHYGMTAVFLVTAVANLALAVALWFEPAQSGHATPEHQQTLRGMIAQSRGERFVWVSAVVAGTAGLMGACANLLVPLQLHANGFSTSMIGAVFGISACVFIATSALVARIGDRAIRIRPIAWTMVAAMVVLVIPASSQASVAFVVFLMLRAPINAYLFSASFPLGAIGARRAGVSVAGVAALINVVWALAMLAGPLVFGTVAQAAGDSVAFVLLIVIFASLALVDHGSRPAVGVGCRADAAARVDFPPHEHDRPGPYRA